jgi:DNA-binding response OmpR family regulator
LQDKILIVDDEENILNVLAYALKREGYLIDTACNGEEALNKVTTFDPNILILDLMLPKINGYDVCRKLYDKNVGIIMLTAKTDFVDKLLGLELGADDYLTKPFDICEVIARVKSLSRRLNKNSSQEEKSINIKNFTMNPNERTVDTHIQRIRKKLGVPYQNLIQTVHGTGYRGVNKLNENRD